MNRKTWLVVAAFCLAVVVLVAFPDVAMAAPGGIVKTAAKSPIVRILFALACLVFFPFIIYYMVRRATAVRRTRAALAQLQTQYPQYRWLELKDRITQVFNWTWSGWTQQKMSVAEGHATPWYIQNQQLQLEDWDRRGVENVCHVEKINDIVPLFVSHVGDGENARLVVSITAKVVDYLRDKGSGAVVQGDTKAADLETIWTFVWHEGAWRLNLIETSDAEFAYLKMPAEISLPAASPQTVR